jgi:UDP-N-acetylglucosamine--N-acetylmuramyl-(pentapeptide) pyrophosphoryl-undecaprenol N-acetylglucosamine transferase
VTAAAAATQGTSHAAGGPGHLWLAAGGTGGHVFPALALADAARAAGWRTTLVGDAAGPEGGWAAAAGVPFVGLPAGKLDRQRPDPRALARAVRGVAAAIGALRRDRPDLVVGFGGFASLPAVAAARLTGTPFVLHETNAFPGIVTRTFARAARLVVLTQAETAARLGGARTAVVPLPVRERRVARGAARAALGVPHDALLTLVMGGSQGSTYLNEALPPIAARLQAERPELWVLHQTGPRWQAGVAASVGARPRYLLEGFVDATVAFAAADLAVTRGGYGTLADAAFHGVPLVVVPLPTAAEDHQRHNAEALAAAGAGLWVAEGDGGALERAWRTLLEPERRASAAAAARRRSPEGGARALLDTLIPLAQRPERAPRRSRT